MIAWEFRNLFRTYYVSDFEIIRLPREKAYKIYLLFKYEFLLLTMKILDRYNILL